MQLTPLSTHWAPRKKNKKKGTIFFGHGVQYTFSQQHRVKWYTTFHCGSRNCSARWQEAHFKSCYPANVRFKTQLSAVGFIRTIHSIVAVSSSPEPVKFFVVNRAVHTSDQFQFKIKPRTDAFKRTHDLIYRGAGKSLARPTS